MSSYASGKAKLFAENFSKSTNLDDSVISLAGFRSETNLKLHRIPGTLKILNKIITDLESSKAFGAAFFPSDGSKEM